MFRFLIITFICVFLLSCESKKTASYYAEHPEEMEAKMRECKEDAAKMMKDPDCINAAEGWNMRFWGVKEKTNKKITPSKQENKKKNIPKGLLRPG